jgi:hypothetical protein
MTLDDAMFAHHHAAGNLHKWPDKTIVANLAAKQVYEVAIENPHVPAKHYVEIHHRNLSSSRKN